MKRMFVLLAGLLAASALVAGSAVADDDDGESAATKTWQVTVTNLTPPGPGAPGSQPLSPPLVVVHTKRANVWSVGTIANHGVAAIAEDANNEVLEAALPSVPGVTSVSTVAGGPIPSGASRTFWVRTAGQANRLSLLTMLVNTNDAITGLDSLRLSGRGGTTMVGAYDAGSEKNNERKTHIPGPCCGNPFVRDPEGALIRHHRGLTGAGDLDPAVYGWNGAVAKIVVERVG
ncbi:MAG: spondin domain-containing protein [Gaiella sp.]